MEVQLLMIISQISLLEGPLSQPLPEECLERIMSGINMQCCLANPNLVASCLSILSDQIPSLKHTKANIRDLFLNLIYLFFCYNCSLKYADLVRGIP